MIHLDLMQYKSDLSIKKEEGQPYIFDPIRKKWLVLQPEEVVRQLIILHLTKTLDYNKNRINVEKELFVNGMQRRSDIMVFDTEMSPFLLVECKAPKVKIDDAVFKQIAWYNMTLKVNYLLVSNGLDTYCCAMDYENERYEFLSEIPQFPG